MPVISNWCSIPLLLRLLSVFYLDILFYQFMKRATDMKQGMIYKIFDMLDFDGSGQIDFNEFYVIICILVAVKVFSTTCNQC